jgi:hypothetical protein
LSASLWDVTTNCLIQLKHATLVISPFTCKKNYSTHLQIVKQNKFFFSIQTLLVLVNVAIKSCGIEFVPFLTIFFYPAIASNKASILSFSS